MDTPYSYSTQHITKLRRRIIARKMLAPDGFFKCPTKQLRKYYNGIGPERWSPFLRKKVTSALDILEAPALIHDFEFSQKEKSYWRFTCANFRLLVNAWKDKCFAAGLAAGVICQFFGYRAYKRGGIIIPIKERNKWKGF